MSPKTRLGTTGIDKYITMLTCLTSLIKGINTQAIKLTLTGKLGFTDMLLRRWRVELVGLNTINPSLQGWQQDRKQEQNDLSGQCINEVFR